MLYDLAVNQLTTEEKFPYAALDFITKNTFTSPEQCLFTNIGTDWSSFYFSTLNVTKSLRSDLTNWVGINYTVKLGLNMPKIINSEKWKLGESDGFTDVCGLVCHCYIENVLNHYYYI